MVKHVPVPQPVLKRLLENLGENIRLARLRRGLTATQVAERADISRPTLHSVENGSPSASLGTYASVLHVLGLEKDLVHVAKDDELGRKLQDAGLLIGKRAPRKT